MNLANKITVTRIILAIILLVLLLVPWEAINLNFPVYLVGNTMVSLKYIIAGIIFLVASVSDFLDGYIARKYNMVTNFGKLVDAIADKMLVDSALIILSAQGFIAPIITVIIILRDIVVDAIKMLAASKGKVVAAIKTGKVKTAFLMFGVIFTMCYNLPFELFNLDISNFLLVLATIFSIISGAEYYLMNKDIIFEREEISNSVENK